MWSFFEGNGGDDGGDGEVIDDKIAGEWRTPQPLIIIPDGDNYCLQKDTSVKMEMKKIVKNDEFNTVIRSVTMTESGGFSATGTVNVRFTRIRWENGAVWAKACREPPEPERPEIDEQTRAEDTQVPQLDNTHTVPILEEDKEVKDFSATFSELILQKEAAHSMMCLCVRSPPAPNVGDDTAHVGLLKDGPIFSEQQMDDIVEKCAECLDTPPPPESVERTMLYNSVVTINEMLRLVLGGFCSNIWINCIEVLIDEVMFHDVKRNNLKAVLQLAVGDKMAKNLEGKVDIPQLSEKTREWVFRLLVNKVIDEFVDITVAGIEASGIL